MLYFKQNYEKYLSIGRVVAKIVCFGCAKFYTFEKIGVGVGVWTMFE
jgi:hypothetical protein